MNTSWIKDSLQKTSTLLASPRFKEVLVFLLFLVASTVLWAVLTMDETLDRTITVRVEVDTASDDIEITQPCARELQVVVRDRGMAFFHYWHRRPDVVRVPISRFQRADFEGHAVLSTADLQKQVQNSLLSTSKVQRILPDSLELYYCQAADRKQVPVEVVGDVKVGGDYYLLSVRPRPATIEVKAPRAILDTLRKVRTQPVVIQGLTKNTVRSTALSPLQGATFNTDNVEVEAQVDVYMENTITIPILTSNFPADRNLRIFPSPEVKVTYTVGYARSKELSTNDFAILLTYEQILQWQRQGYTRIPLQLRSLPKGVSNVRLEPSEVDYLIETVDEEE